MIIVNDCKQLTIVTEKSVLHVAGLYYYCFSRKSSILSNILIHIYIFNILIL